MQYAQQPMQSSHQSVPQASDFQNWTEADRAVLEDIMKADHSSSLGDYM
jgi:hypothetical protein